jgi:hypothetical protein
MAIPPAPRPLPLWHRALLRAATGFWWGLCMAQSCRRDLARLTQTAVWHRRAVRGGWPTRYHPDRLADLGLSFRQEAALARLDNEAAAALPADLRIALTCGLTSPLIRLTSPRGSR